MTHTDHRMEAARRTNQSNGRGWCFAPELDHFEPWYVRVLSAFGHKAVWIGLGMLSLMVWLLINYRGE